MTRDELQAYPPVLFTRHMAEIFPYSQDNIRAQVKAGRFPIPRLERMTRLAWSRARVAEFFEQDTFAAPKRRAS